MTFGRSRGRSDGRWRRDLSETDERGAFHTGRVKGYRCDRLRSSSTIEACGTTAKGDRPAACCGERAGMVDAGPNRLLPVLNLSAAASLAVQKAKSSGTSFLQIFTRRYRLGFASDSFLFLLNPILPMNLTGFRARSPESRAR